MTKQNGKRTGDVDLLLLYRYSIFLLSAARLYLCRYTLRRRRSWSTNDLVNDGEQDLRGNNPSVTAPVCMATLCNTSSITQPTQHGSNPVWDQAFDFPVSHVPVYILMRVGLKNKHRWR